MVSSKSIEVLNAATLESLLDERGLKEETLISEVVYEGDFLTVYRDEIVLPNGEHGQREYMKHPGAVMIMPVFENGDVLLERQYRYPLHSVFIEFPAGKKDLGELPLETAHRELLEETGYRAQKMTHVTDIYNAMGYCDEVIHFYVAEALHSQGAQMLDDNEFVELMRVSLSELFEWIRKGWVPDVKTQLGAFWLRDYLERKKG